MIDNSKLDLGSIQIHKKVIAEITQSALEEFEGVKLAANHLTGRLSELFGRKTYPGVAIHVDKNSQVTIEVKVHIRYGLNIPDIARQIQDRVRRAVEQTTDIDLKDINVNIQGISRPKA